uniref:CARD domain-containing protein n=1 Tax=Sinocyclocheilus grahami TaxID=75366 RepID=A0A672QNY5_SINGR
MEVNGYQQLLGFDKISYFVFRSKKKLIQFVDRYSNKLIQKVTVVMPIADSLKAVKIIHEETYSNIFVASTNMAKLRVLLDALNTNKAKSAFYDLLKVNESFLVEDLKREGERE